jgi:hypothetical protein
LRIFTPFVRRAIAVAAVFLIAVGLVWWLPRGNDDGKDSEPQFALLVQSGKPRLKALLPAQIRDKATEAVAIVPLAARNGEAFREDLKQAQRGDKLPLPPEVALELVLVNAGKRAVEVRLGDAGSELSLDVPGEAVVRVTAPKAELPAALRPQTLQLEEGQRHVIHIDRLVAGSPGKLEYIYLTEPGEYKLTARLRLTADGRAATVTAEPVRIKVDR